MIATVDMDSHTLELLEFGQGGARELLASYAACSPRQGVGLPAKMEPSTDPVRVRAELALVSEMVDAAWRLGHARPSASLHDDAAC